MVAHRGVTSRKEWEVKCPPLKKHMVAGTLVPTVRGGVFGKLRRAKPRKLVIEVVGEDGGEHNSSAGLLPQSVQDLKRTDQVMIRILKPRTHWGLSRDYDDTDSDDDDDNHDNDNDDDDDHGWIEYRKFDLDDIDQDGAEIKNESYETKFGCGNALEVREIHFESSSANQDFVSDLKRLVTLQKERGAMEIASYQQSKMDASSSNKTRGDIVKLSSTITNEDINLLVEVVSATDLPIMDRNASTDPYVVCWMGKQEVHRTKVIPNSTDPIYTVDTGSLFILSTTATEFFGSSTGLTFVLKDYDAVGSNDAIGKVVIPQAELLDATGERVEYEIDVPGGVDKKAIFQPKLNVRVRPATREDFKFLKTLHSVQKNKKLGVYANAAFVAPLPHTVNRLKRETKSSANGDLHRVKPGPDPEREEQDTKWLTKGDIYMEHLKPSTNWIETGSGKLGRLYLEILRCDKLPNLDTGALGDKTDAFCCVIYEDAICNSDVINDELSPRWMPWSQRAFLFHMQHPSSQVLLGVFDYDKLVNDPIGRCSIDVTNFRSDTDYILTYTLYESVLDEVREPRGTITVRLRLDIPSFRSVVAASLGPPPANFINVAKKHEFCSARFVTQGEENLRKLDMAALKSYGNELSSYADVVFYVKQAAMTVILWRGHYRVNCCGCCKFKLPVHSMVAFVVSICLVENYDLLPSVFFFTIAWFFLATNEQRQRNPSPWHQSATFGQFWYALLKGKNAGYKIVDVANNEELQPLVKAYEESLEALRKQQQERADKNKEQTGLMDAYFAQEELETSEVAEDIATDTGGLQLNPLKPVLLPIQMILGQICEALRVARSVILWDESVYAFLITNVCLILAVALFFVPWSWILRWVLRIVVWTLLGPWMKLVDIFVVRKLESDEDNVVKRMEVSMEQRSKLLLLKKRTIMTLKEDSLKLSAMKRYMFGRYLAHVPRFKQYRYPDVPMADYSSSEPHDDTVYSAVRVVDRKHGQRLVGHMIPTWGDDEGEGGAVLTAKAAEAKPSLVSRASPMRLFGSNKGKKN